jgi:hypothetical protein
VTAPPGLLGGGGSPCGFALDPGTQLGQDIRWPGAHKARSVPHRHPTKSALGSCELDACRAIWRSPLSTHNGPA